MFEALAAALGLLLLVLIGLHAEDLRRLFERLWQPIRTGLNKVEQALGSAWRVVPALGRKVLACLTPLIEKPGLIGFAMLGLAVAIAVVNLNLLATYLVEVLPANDSYIIYFFDQEVEVTTAGLFAGVWLLIEVGCGILALHLQKSWQKVLWTAALTAIAVLEGVLAGWLTFVAGGELLLAYVNGFIAAMVAGVAAVAGGIAFDAALSGLVSGLCFATTIILVCLVLLVASLPVVIIAAVPALVELCLTLCGLGLKAVISAGWWFRARYLQWRADRRSARWRHLRHVAARRRAAANRWRRRSERVRGIVRHLLLWWRRRWCAGRSPQQTREQQRQLGDNGPLTPSPVLEQEPRSLEAWARNLDWSSLPLDNDGGSQHRRVAPLAVHRGEESQHEEP